MDLTVLTTLANTIVSFLLGKVTARKRNSAETDSIIVKNVHDTMKIYELTYIDKIKHISDKYTELKVEMEKIKEENVILKMKIVELEKINLDRDRNNY